MAVLYFDDEPFISRALAENLSFCYDWKVTLISEIDDLFQELANNPYDILILDIMVPIPEKNKNSTISFTKKDIEEMEGGMSTGIVLAKKIWKSHESIPILFLSARSRPDAIANFQKEGKKCEYLRKPELAETVDAALDQLLNPKSDEK